MIVRIIYSAIILVLPFSGIAQNAAFFTSGVIEYEKSVNMYAVIKKGINKDNELFMQDAFDKYKQGNPQFRVLTSSLRFNGDQTIFRPDQGNAFPGMFNEMAMVVQHNTVHTNFNTGVQITGKAVYGNTYLLKDSMRTIRWKITDETRVIAGYTCRRANALILDSVYVVAFFSDEIHVSGGPESFCGLPGMILQVVLPHENITWVAKKVTITDVPITELSGPQSGKPVNRAELQTEIERIGAGLSEGLPELLKAFLL